MAGVVAMLKIKGGTKDIIMVALEKTSQMLNQLLLLGAKNCFVVYIQQNIPWEKLQLTLKCMQL